MSLILLSLAVLAALMLLAGPADFLGRPTPLVIGHRGCPARRPENTMASFEQAIAEGADMIELDVQLSADCQLVVIHDATLERTTNGHGLVAMHTLEQLRGLDAGGWFDPRLADQRPPTLAEVFEAFGQRTLINVEIKAEALCLPLPGWTVVELTLAEIARCGLERTTVVSSMSFDALLMARAINPRLNLAVLAHGPKPGIDTAMLCQAIGARAFNFHISSVTLDLTESLHRAGLLALPYADASVTPSAMARALELGCDGFFADDPAALRAMIDKQGGAKAAR
ncbi:glycerophosphodiester phosphodiesterase [Desulfarculus baarsii]